MNFQKFFHQYGDELMFISIVLAVAFVLIRLSRWLLHRYLRRMADLLRMDPTKFRFLKNSMTVIILMVAVVVIIYGLPGGKTIAVSLFASAGVLAAILGFASQAALSNVISGIFIVMFKPFRVQDWIELGSGKRGIVEDITLRHTVIRDFENNRIIIPNSVISADTIVNCSIADPRTCIHIEFQITFESDIKLARSILQDEAGKHALCIDNRTPKEKESGTPVVLVRVIGFADSGVRLRTYVWAKNPEDAWDLFTDLNESVKERFFREGIQIPYPHRVLVNPTTYSSTNLHPSVPS